MQAPSRRYVQYLAIIAAAVTVAAFVYSYSVFDRLDETTRDLISLDGFDAAFYPPTWAPYVYYSVQLLALILLLNPTKLTKYFFLANVVFFNGFGMLLGVSIALPVEVLFQTVIQYIYGAIVFLVIYEEFVLGRHPQG